MTKTILLATAALLVMVPAANAACNVRMAQYEALKTGMTIAQANAAVGCDAKEVNRAAIGSFETVGYTWDGPEFSSLIATFNNGRLAMKMQMGLKK